MSTPADEVLNEVNKNLGADTDTESDSDSTDITAVTVPGVLNEEALASAVKQDAQKSADEAARIDAYTRDTVGGGLDSEKKLQQNTLALYLTSVPSIKIKNPEYIIELLEYITGEIKQKIRGSNTDKNFLKNTDDNSKFLPFIIPFMDANRNSRIYSYNTENQSPQFSYKEENGEIKDDDDGFAQQNTFENILFYVDLDESINASMFGNDVDDIVETTAAEQAVETPKEAAEEAETEAAESEEAAEEAETEGAESDEERLAEETAPETAPAPAEETAPETAPAEEEEKAEEEEEEEKAEEEKAESEAEPETEEKVSRTGDTGVSSGSLPPQPTEQTPPQPEQQGGKRKNAIKAMKMNFKNLTAKMRPNSGTKQKRHTRKSRK